MAEVQLYDYQQKVVNKANDLQNNQEGINQNLLFVAPTGSGKTAVAVEMLKKPDANYDILVGNAKTAETLKETFQKAFPGRTVYVYSNVEKPTEIEMLAACVQMFEKLTGEKDVWKEWKSHSTIRGSYNDSLEIDFDDLAHLVGQESGSGTYNIAIEFFNKITDNKEQIDKIESIPPAAFAAVDKTAINIYTPEGYLDYLNGKTPILKNVIVDEAHLMASKTFEEIKKKQQEIVKVKNDEAQKNTQEGETFTPKNVVSVLMTATPELQLENGQASATSYFQEGKTNHRIEITRRQMQESGAYSSQLNHLKEIGWNNQNAKKTSLKVLKRILTHQIHENKVVEFAKKYHEERAPHLKIQEEILEKVEELRKYKIGFNLLKKLDKEIEKQNTQVKISGYASTEKNKLDNLIKTRKDIKKMGIQHIPTNKWIDKKINAIESIFAEDIIERNTFEPSGKIDTGYKALQEVEREFKEEQKQKQIKQKQSNPQQVNKNNKELILKAKELNTQYQPAIELLKSLKGAEKYIEAQEKLDKIDTDIDAVTNSMGKANLFIRQDGMTPELLNQVQQTINQAFFNDLQDLQDTNKNSRYQNEQKLNRILQGREAVNHLHVHKDSREILNAGKSYLPESNISTNRLLNDRTNFEARNNNSYNIWADMLLNAVNPNINIHQFLEDNTKLDFSKVKDLISEINEDALDNTIKKMKEQMQFGLEYYFPKNKPLVEEKMKLFDEILNSIKGEINYSKDSTKIHDGQLSQELLNKKLDSFFNEIEYATQYDNNANLSKFTEFTKLIANFWIVPQSFGTGYNNNHLATVFGEKGNLQHEGRVNRVNNYKMGNYVGMEPNDKKNKNRRHG